MSDVMQEARMALAGTESAQKQETTNSEPKAAPKAEPKSPMATVLEAVEAKIEVSAPKIEPGMTLIGVSLDRNPERAGQFMEAIGRDWQVTGWAIAIRDGHVVAGNAIFGRWTNGVPKVSAMHWCVCAKCGRRVPMPLVVWEAKDAARRLGVEVKDEEPGKSVLDKYGSCPCGAKWSIDDKGEKESLGGFADKVIKTFSEAPGPVPPYLPPAAFTVGKNGKVGPQWDWLHDAMAKAGKAVAPFTKDDRGDVIIFNPGFWLGWVGNAHDTGLFWDEKGKEHKRHAQPAFNPSAVAGL